MLDLCLIYQPGSRQVKKSFIKIITGHFTNVTGRGLAQDWEKSESGLLYS
jgi:hypothetical protein